VALFLTCEIDAMEKRCVAATDIPGAFMDANIDVTIYAHFESTLTDFLIRINPKLCRKYVYKEKRKPELYATLAETLYGTLHAALLF
jgi:hypothetical protein